MSSTSFDRFVRALDRDPSTRGRQFEAVCRWFLRNDPLYRDEVERVWAWAEWPGRWGADAGIDLVARDREGRLWAVQAKCYDPAHAITKADVDTFLSESGRPGFAFRLLIATTDRIGATARRTIRDQEKPAHLVMLSDLRSSRAPWPASPDDLRPRPVPARAPRDHQQEAVAGVAAGFVAHDRGQLIMACGTGKTLTALWIAEALGAQRVLVLLPSLSLLAQTLREWTTEARFPYLAVCSDETVVEGDEVVSHPSDLGVPVTTDPAAITAFVARAEQGVVFATYQSSPRLAAALAGSSLAFDLAIADEAQRCAGPAAGPFATILNAEAIPVAKRLFMTATPRVYSERLRREASEDGFEVASMDDPARFGPIFHRLSFAQAIGQGLLADYRVAVVGFDDPTYREWAERGRLVTTDGASATDARSLAGAVGVAKAMQSYDLRRVVSFHRRIKGARHFSTDFPGVVSWMPEEERPSGRVWAQTVTGEMASGERDVLLGRFRGLEPGERAVLSNARCLAEGVDVPAIDGVAFLDPRRSPVDVVQAVGRAIRKADDKRAGTIVVPVFVDADEDAQEALEGSAFKPVWDVLRALRAHDEELGEQLDALRRELGPRGTGSAPWPERIVLDLPTTVGKDFVRALRLRLVEEATSRWEQSFGATVRYAARIGTALIPTNAVDNDGVKVGRWVHKQRMRYRSGDLAPDRVARLEALPCWSWDPDGDRWEEGFARLAAFAAREGHARVPTKHLEDGFRLGQWVNVARTQWQRGELPPERVSRLEDLPDWAWDGRSAKWEDGYRRLVRYVDGEGNARVPKEHVEDTFNLGTWVGNQRRFQANGQLSDERADRLAALKGWTWDSLDEDWERSYDVLRRYAARERHARVSQEHEEDGVQLGRWVAIQRRRRDRMDPPRARRLEAVTGWAWNALEADWDGTLDRLRAFAEREGHVRLPTGADPVLERWVANQRKAHRRGELRADRVDRLASVPGWEWDPAESAWEHAFRRLVAFVGEHGRANVPQQLVDGKLQLGRWVTNQRTEFKAGRLDPDRARRLAALPGWSWTPRETSWDEGLARLLCFAEREGSASPSESYTDPDGFKLGSWVRRQRQDYRKGRLAPDRARQLEQVLGWRWESPRDAWEDGFAPLATFVDREGHALVPAAHDEAGFDLGGWVSRQRQARRRGQLASDREPLLAVLPGWSWRSKADRWEEGYAALKRYVLREGNAQVERDHVEDGFKLGAWVVEQRQARRLDRMQPGRAERLEALPGWSWSRRGHVWEQGYAHLLQYAAREGHAQVPAGHVEDGFKLGCWVANQRSRPQMDPERGSRLEVVPGWNRWPPEHEGHKGKENR